MTRLTNALSAACIALFDAYQAAADEADRTALQDMLDRVEALCATQEAIERRDREERNAR